MNLSKKILFIFIIQLALGCSLFGQESLYKTYTMENSRYLVHKVLDRLGCLIFDFSTAPVYVTLERKGKEREWIKMDYSNENGALFFNKDSACQLAPSEFNNCFEIWQNEGGEKQLFWFRYSNWKISEGSFNVNELDNEIIIRDVQVVKSAPKFINAPK
jgi:hypothetical protein